MKDRNEKIVAWILASLIALALSACDMGGKVSDDGRFQWRIAGEGFPY